MSHFIHSSTALGSGVKTGRSKYLTLRSLNSSSRIQEKEFIYIYTHTHTYEVVIGVTEKKKQGKG